MSDLVDNEFMVSRCPVIPCYATLNSTSVLTTIDAHKTAIKSI